MMRNWLDRHAEREDELARGVDSTLVQANQRRYRLAWLLIAVSFVLGVLIRAVGLSGGLGWILNLLTFAVFLSGFILLQWAKQEKAHLHESGPRKPPSMMKRMGDMRVSGG